MMRVTGTFDTGVDLVDGTTALMPIGAVRRMLGYGEHEASVVSVYLDQHKAADRVAASLRGTVDLETMEVFTWESTQSEIAGMISIDAAMNYMFQLLLGVLVAAGILNTMLMSVLERRREMGIMMAVGMTRGRLFRLVLLESSLVATLGSAVGFLATVPWYAYMSTTGIDLSEYLGDDMNMSGIAIEPVLRLWLDGPAIAAILGGAFALTLAASLYPAFRAGRDAPVESIRSI